MTQDEEQNSIKKQNLERTSHWEINYQSKETFKSAHFPTVQEERAEENKEFMLNVHYISVYCVNMEKLEVWEPTQIGVNNGNLGVKNKMLKCKYNIFTFY